MSELQNIRKKTFDPTVTFSVFGSWVKAVESVEQVDGIEGAYMLCKAISHYSMYGEEPDFTEHPNLYPTWYLIQREADMSIGRRKRNFSSEESEEKSRTVRAAIESNPSASVRKISEITGISKSSVDRIKQKVQNAASAGIDTGTDTGIDTGIDTGTGTGIDTGTGTTGRDSGTPRTFLSLDNAFNRTSGGLKEGIPLSGVSEEDLDESEMPF